MDSSQSLGLAFSIILGILGLLLIGNTYKARKKIETARRTWPKTEGKVTDSEVSISEASIYLDKPPSERKIDYTLKVSFTYSVIGTGYSCQINQKHSTSENVTKAQKELTIGTAIPVIYNPEKPEECFTAYDKEGGKGGYLLGGFLFAYAFFRVWTNFVK